MKTILILISLIAIFIIYYFNKLIRRNKSIGTIKDIEINIKNLIENNNKIEYLIINIKGKEDFIQFTADSNGVQMDYPLITERQKSNEIKFKSICNKQNLIVNETKGSTGDIFLDVELNHNYNKISEIVSIFIEDLFNISESTKLEFKTNLT